MKLSNIKPSTEFYLVAILDVLSIYGIMSGKLPPESTDDISPLWRWVAEFGANLAEQAMRVQSTLRDPVTGLSRRCRLATARSTIPGSPWRTHSGHLN